MSLHRWRGFGPMDDFVGLRNSSRVLTDPQSVPDELYEAAQRDGASWW